MSGYCAADRARFFLVSCMMFLIAPYSPLLATAQADDVKARCDAIETDLYLIGIRIYNSRPLLNCSLILLPLVSLETAVTSSEPVGKWILNPWLVLYLNLDGWMD